MIELTLLGPHALRGGDGQELTSLLAQPKRFALLAYLALDQTGGYHRRDTLVALFWPDMDQFAARRALRNSLYHLREALGDGVIVTRGDNAVSVNPAQLRCDVAMLNEAWAAARHEEVVDIYRGELLAGMHFVNAGEAFEEWLSGERLRITGMVVESLRTLVDREEKAGRMVSAAHWAQRACTVAVGDEGWLRRAMTLLDQASDTGSALRMYDQHVRRLTTEFAAAPHAETRALAATIRSGSAHVAATPRNASATFSQPVDAAPVVALSPDSSDASSRGPTDAVVKQDLAGATPSPITPRTPRNRFVRRIGIAATLVLAAAAGLIAIRARRSDSLHTVAARQRVLVAVFENRTGDSTLQSLGRMTQDWIAQGIVRTQMVDVVDPRAVFVQSRTAGGGPPDLVALAHRTGAGLIVSGSYYRTGDTLLFQAAVMDVPTARIVQVVGPILAQTGTPVAALDELRSRVMTALASVVDVHATFGLGGGQPPPYDAYQAYVDGWDAFWHGDPAHAKALFIRASQRDTAFIDAALSAAVVAANSNDCGTVDSVARVLGARSPALDRVGRLSLQIADARCRGRNEEMLQLTLERADLEPRNAGDQMAAAAAALWANRPARALELLKRVNPSVDLGWATDTTHFVYWNGVAESMHLLGRHEDELTAASHLSAGAPLGRIWLRASALAALSRPAETLALLDSAMVLPVEPTSSLGLAPYTTGRPQYTMTPGWVANWVARELAVHGDTAAARQAAMRGIAWHRSRPAEERAMPEEQLVAVWSLEMMGARAAADSIVRQLVSSDSANVDFRGEQATLAAERGDTALADSVDHWLAAQPAARVSWSASLYRARVAALLGHNDDAVARLREAFDEGLWPRWLHQEPALAALRRRADFMALVAPRE